VKHLPLIHPGRSSTEEGTMRGIRNDVTLHPSFGIAAHCHGWGKRGRSSAFDVRVPLAWPRRIGRESCNGLLRGGS
jgi:hypothetical protein